MNGVAVFEPNFGHIAARWEAAPVGQFFHHFSTRASLISPIAQMNFTPIKSNKMESYDMTRWPMQPLFLYNLINKSSSQLSAIFARFRFVAL